MTSFYVFCVCVHSTLSCLVLCTSERFDGSVFDLTCAMVKRWIKNNTPMASSRHQNGAFSLRGHIAKMVRIVML